MEIGNKITILLFIVCVIELAVIYFTMKKKGTFNGFYSIFKDGNDWNEKNIIGFLSFGIMALFAFADITTGYVGNDLVINDGIYNSFLIVTMGCFGIDGAQKIMSNKKKEESSDTDE